MQRTARLNCALGMIYFRRRWSENLVQLTERGQEGNPAVVAFKELLDQREAAWWDWCLAVPKAGRPQPADVALRPAIDVDDLSRMIWAEGSLSLLPQDHPLVAVVRDSAAAPWIKDLHMWAGPESWPPGYTGIIKPLPPLLELTPESIERSINDITHRIVFRLQMRQEQRAALQRELPGSEAWIDTPQLEAVWKILDAELRLVAACGRLDVAAWDKREASLKSATMRWGVECSHSDRHLSLEQALRLVSEPRRTALRREGLAMLDQLRQATLEVESQPSLVAPALPLEPTQSDLEAVDLEATNRERLVDALEQLESELETKP